MIPFKLGDKVVCINAKDTNSKNTPELVEGQIYVIRWIGPYDGTRFDAALGLKFTPAVCVRVEGVRRNEKLDKGFLDALNETFGITEEDLDKPFYASRFRPLVTTKTDISIFTAMLDTVKQLEPIEG